MSNDARMKAEQLFAGLQNKAERALTEVEEAQRARVERAAELRALRLAKEAADKAAAAAKPRKK
jgi:hypothetical protein